jgi:hypothetical protein
MRVDAIIVPASQADDLANQIARLWPVDHGACTALDLAIVEGLAAADSTRLVGCARFGVRFLARRCP